jgi:hypothetical protein
MMFSGSFQKWSKSSQVGSSKRGFSLQRHARACRLPGLSVQQRIICLDKFRDPAALDAANSLHPCL